MVLKSHTTFLSGIGLLGMTTMFWASPIRADILWGTAQDITGVSDIATSGTFIEATQTNSGTAVTVTNSGGQNFLFDASAGSGSPSTGGYITINYDNASAPDNGVNLGTTNTTSTNTNYNNAISDGLVFENSGQTGTVTLNNLVSGDNYQVEVWSYWDGGTTTTALATLSGSTPVTINADIYNDSTETADTAGDPAGQFAIGTFTASGTSQAFTFTVPAGSSYAVINDVALWNVTAVPAPATLGLIAIGAMGGLLLRRRRPLGSRAIS